MRFFKGTAAQRASSEKTGAGGDLVIESDTGHIAVADGASTLGDLQRLARADEVPILDEDGKVPEEHVPDRLSESGLSASIEAFTEVQVPPLVAAALADDETIAEGALAVAEDAVATAAASGGLLATTKIPALATNLLHDPRMTNTARWTETAGVTFDATGVSGATVTGDGGVSRNFYEAVDFDCAPGDVFSAGAYYTLTGGTSANSRISFLWFNGTTANGEDTGTNVAATAIETRYTKTSVPAPSGTTKLRVAFYGRNMTGNAILRIRKGMVVRGSTLPAHFDGTSAAAAWTNPASPDNSTSDLLFLPSAEVATLRTLPALVFPSPVTLTKSGVDHTITSLLGTSTLATLTRSNGSNNGAFNILSTTLDGVTIWNNGDDIAPIRTQNGYIGGGHAFAGCGAFTNPDGKTSADLGSRWTDGTREYVFMGFEPFTGKLIMGGSYTSPGGVTTYLAVAPAANLTHVSGATHTGAIDYTTKTNTQLFPAIKRIQVSYWVDGKQITADGITGGREVAVRETYDIMDYASVYDLMKANVGAVHTALPVTGCVRVSNVFRFTAGGRCRVRTELVELAPTTIEKAGATQSFPPGNPSNTLLPGATRARYLPGVGTVGGINWGAGVDVDSGYATTQIAPTDAPNGAPFCMDVVTVSGSVLFGWAVGYLPYGVRGDEDSRNSARQANTTTAMWEMNTSMKVYPHFKQGVAGWGRLTAEAFRTYLTAAQVAAVLAAKDSPAGAFAALDAVKGVTPAL